MKICRYFSKGQEPRGKDHEKYRKRRYMIAFQQYNLCCQDQFVFDSTKMIFHALSRIPHKKGEKALTSPALREWFYKHTILKNVRKQVPRSSKPQRETDHLSLVSTSSMSVLSVNQLTISIKMVGADWLLWSEETGKKANAI